MAEKNLKARIVHKHDVEANWLLATGFTPKQGEIIVYDIDDNYNYERFKIGDGIQNVNALPFAEDALKTALEAEIGEVSALVGDTSVSEQIDTAIEESKADWNQNDETAADYIKNRTHYDSRYYVPTEEKTVSGTVVTWGLMKVADTIDFDISKVSSMSLRTSTGIEIIDAPVLISSYFNGTCLGANATEYGEYWYFTYFATQEEADVFWDNDEEENPFEVGLYVYAFWPEEDRDAEDGESVEITYSFNVTHGELQQIDSKYFPFVEKTSDFVFEAEIIDTNQFEDISCRKLVGQYKVYVDDTFEIVEFIDEEDYSYAKYTSSDFLISIETWNGGIWLDTNLDGNTHLVGIQENKNVIKEEYLPHDLATIDTVLNVVDTIEQAKIPICQAHSTDGETYTIYVDKDIRHGELLTIIPDMESTSKDVDLKVNGQIYDVKICAEGSTGGYCELPSPYFFYPNMPVLVMLFTEGAYKNSAFVVGFRGHFTESYGYICDDSADTVVKTVITDETISVNYRHGSTLYISFTNGNTANNPQLKIDNGFSMPIVDRSGAAISADAIKAGLVYQFVYNAKTNPSSWVLMDTCQDDSMRFNGNKELTLPANTYFWPTAYGDGRYVAIAYDSDIAIYSEDGVNWMQSKLPMKAEWYSVTYGGGKFVAVARFQGYAACSEDGINWTKISLSGYGSWNSIAYGNGTFVAICTNGETSGTTALSTDGINWIQSSALTGRYLSSITYCNGKFIVPVLNSNVVLYSDFGVNWNEAYLPEASQWFCAAYGDGKFVVLSHHTSCAYSEDGINWTSYNLPIDKPWESLIYGDGKFIAIADDAYIYSEDGINWTPSSISTNGSWRSVTHGNDKYVAFSEDTYAYSYDGITWCSTYEAIVQDDEDVTDQVRDLILGDITNVEIDATLSVEGQAADAKAVGEAIDGLNALVGDTNVATQISNAVAQKSQVQIITWEADD